MNTTSCLGVNDVVEIYNSVSKGQREAETIVEDMRLNRIRFKLQDIDELEREKCVWWYDFGYEEAYDEAYS